MYQAHDTTHNHIALEVLRRGVLTVNSISQRINSVISKSFCSLLSLIHRTFIRKNLQQRRFSVAKLALE